MRYYLIAGEASGDLHGSNLMKGLYRADPGAVIRFWGGDLMKAVYDANEKGSDGLVVHYREGAVMGYTDVLKKAGKLLGNVRRCKRDILSWRPDVVILIDYPGFNFKIAAFAHSRGLRVYYYIAPKVWASREGRIRKLREYVDRLFIVFPFEVPYFTSKGIDFIYKGNPLVDAIDDSPAMKETREDFLSRNNLPDKPIIALLAGSRKGEISTMTAPLLGFARKMHAIPEYSDYLFIVAGAPARILSDYEAFLNCDYIKVIFDQTQSIVHHARAAVINSGTASLEAVLLGTPQVVGYRLNPLTYLVGRLIVKVKYISLGNLCIDRPAFRELIQNDCNPDTLLREIRRILEDSAYTARMLSDYAAIRSLLGDSGTSLAVAEAVVSSLRSK